MKINNYSYGGNKQPKTGVSKGIGAGYIIILAVFFVIFIIMAVLFIGMRKNLNKESEQQNEEVAETVEEDGISEDTVLYEGFKEIVNDAFSDKAGYYYSVDVTASDDNAYFMSDSVLKDITNGAAYSITGNIFEKGVSGQVNVLRDNYSVSYDYCFTGNSSILNADLSGYLINKGESDDKIYEKGLVSNVSLEDKVSGIAVMKALRDAFLNADAAEQGSESGEYYAVFEKGSFKLNTGYKYIDRLFNDYPGEMTVTISTEDSKDADQTRTFIYIEGPVTADITLDEYKTINTDDTLISNGFNHYEGGAFSVENSPELTNLSDALKEF